MIDALPGNQLLMGAGLGNAAVVYHQDLVRVLDVPVDRLNSRILIRYAPRASRQ